MKVGSKIGGGWASVGWVDGREHNGRREHVVGRHAPSARSCLPVTHVAPNGIREEASPLYTVIQIEDFIDILSNGPRSGRSPTTSLMGEAQLRNNSTCRCYCHRLEMKMVGKDR